MSNPAKRQVSFSTLVKDVAQLQGEQKNMATSINQVLMMMRQQLMDTAEMTSALATMLGKDEVDKVIKEERIKRLTENMEVEKAQIAQAVADGKLITSEVVTPKSLIIGCEFEADGTPRPPGRAHVQFTTLGSKFQEILLGKAKGFVLEPTPAGGKFEVYEIYEEVPPKPQADAGSPPSVQAAGTAELTDESVDKVPNDDGQVAPVLPLSEQKPAVDQNAAPVETAVPAETGEASGFSFDD